MKKKELIASIIVIVIGALLLFVIYTLNNDIQRSLRMFKTPTVEFILMGLSLSLFGILIEYKGVIEAIKTGININILRLILAIVLLIISCLPQYFSIPIYSLNGVRLNAFLDAEVTRNIFSIWSGILISKSLLIK